MPIYRTSYQDYSDMWAMVEDDMDYKAIQD
jgi:hypothetical protein